MGQTGQDFLITYKVETVLGVTPVVLTGAKQFPCNASRGMSSGRAPIRPGIIRSDGQTGSSRLGLETVTGEFTADFIPDVFDEIIEAGVRGTWASDILEPGATPTKRTFTFEIYEVANGIRRVFNGVRVISLGFGLTPTGMATITVGFQGIKGLTPAVGASIWTSPTLYNGAGMVPIDAAISFNGVARTTITGYDFTIGTGAENVAVIGSIYSPDVYDGNLSGSGTVRAIRAAIADEVAFRAETRQAIAVVLAASAGGPAELTITLPRVMYTGFDYGIGGTGPVVATLPFDIEYDATEGSMIKFERAA
jgi:Phage tail tube protein